MKYIPELRLHAWVRELVPYAGKTIKDACYAYFMYCTKGGKAQFEVGVEPHQPAKAAKPSNKSDQVIAMIKKGMNLRAILGTEGFAGMKRVIMDNLRFYPAREGVTEVLMVAGPSGIGKTTTCRQVLFAFKEANPKLHFNWYQKPNGWSKFHEAYDMEKLCWMEVSHLQPTMHRSMLSHTQDPGSIHAGGYEKKYESWLQVLGNEGECLVEVKFGSVPFVAKCILCTTNLNLSQMLEGIPEYHQEAFRSRLSKNVFVLKHVDERGDLKEWLGAKLAENYGGISPYSDEAYDSSTEDGANFEESQLHEARQRSVRDLEPQFEEAMADDDELEWEFDPAKPYNPIDSPVGYKEHPEPYKGDSEIPGWAMQQGEPYLGPRTPDSLTVELDD